MFFICVVIGSRVARRSSATLAFFNFLPFPLFSIPIIFNNWGLISALVILADANNALLARSSLSVVACSAVNPARAADPAALAR